MGVRITESGVGGSSTVTFVPGLSNGNANVSALTVTTPAAVCRLTNPFSLVLITCAGTLFVGVVAGALGAAVAGCDGVVGDVGAEA